MPNVKREGGVLKPIPKREKMYIAFKMPNNPTCDPKGLDHDFKEQGRFMGMSGSEDQLRTMLRREATLEPNEVFAIFEIVRLIESKPVQEVQVVDRNMR